MPTETINGIDLYYESHGEGPALVFLHGAGGNHISWWQQVPRFREQYRCITIDHRGFGASLDPKQEGAARFVDDLEALLDRLEIERAALVAQSMGGRTALGFAVEHPERVPALVMCDTWGFFDWPELQEKVREYRERNAGEGGLAQRALGPSFQEREPDKTLLYQQVFALNPPRENTAFQSEITAEEVAALAVPTMFIVGSDDGLTPPEILHEVHELIPGSAFVEFKGCGHSVYWENPEDYNHTVALFLEQHPW
ncbi:MAG: alpha/beta fold hydrolase [Dehalococcoidia bacterium]